jgi:hypothetical protein
LALPEIGIPQLDLYQARDAAGELQPDKHDQWYGSYAVRHTLPIKVVVG